SATGWGEVVRDTDRFHPASHRSSPLGGCSGGVCWPCWAARVAGSGRFGSPEGVVRGSHTGRSLLVRGSHTLSEGSAGAGADANAAVASAYVAGTVVLRPEVSAGGVGSAGVMSRSLGSRTAAVIPPLCAGRSRTSIPCR